MKSTIPMRTLSLLLVLAMLLSVAMPGAAATTARTLEKLDYVQTQDYTGAVEEGSLYQQQQTSDPHDPQEMVRVSIVLDTPSTLEAGYSTRNISRNSQAMAYRQERQAQQETLTATISRTLGRELDVVWNLTLAANLISANVEYGQIETIAALEGVKEVVLEARHDPCVVEREEISSPTSSTSASQIGSAGAYAMGYTGAGSRIAIIDTGIDCDHQSFSNDAYLYSLSQLAQEADMEEAAYVESLNLLDTEEISQVLPLLNLARRGDTATAEDLYRNEKMPFGYNYVDDRPDYIDHDQDSEGGHGSHVAGIAAANRFIPQADGSFATAVDTVHAQGVAPDAQILVMKVFGILGGAYTSDFMAAIEDAVLLGCDAVNLSLGSAASGFTFAGSYQKIMDTLAESDTVVAISSGNRGSWFEELSTDGQLYAEDVNTHTDGMPGSYTNALTVASVDNTGSVGYYLTVGGEDIIYSERLYGNLPLRTLAGQQEYIFLDSFGTEAEFAALEPVLEGKIAICSRGGNSFFQKAEAAVAHGAIATIIYNNTTGSINMDLTDYTQTAPCVSITQKQGAAIQALSGVEVCNGVEYRAGTLTVSGDEGYFMDADALSVVSDFSSWGVPGTLELKPEIAAPGGSIYSVNGEVAGGTAYVTMSGTSMAAPQTAGMAALVAQYLRQQDIPARTGLSPRVLAQSLLMSTARPLKTEEGTYFPVLQQGSGLGNVGEALSAHSYLLMDETATDSAADGKIKAELKDDPNRTGVYSFGFTIHNLEDTTQQYMLSADFFSQDWYTDGTYGYMAGTTRDMETLVSWQADGTTLEPAGDISGYDFNGDGVVNLQDVQTLVDYAAGLVTALSNSHLADISGDGAVSTYDGHLLLKALNQGLVTVAPGGQAHVTVTVTLTDSQKAWLDQHFENGTYVQGFVYARELPTREGVAGTEHSIPILGFYGNWSDPSMFEQGSYAERAYGMDKPFYLTYSAQSHNSFVLRYPDKTTQYHSGNPYGVEDTYPAEKEAINPRTSLYSLPLGLIRDAAAAFMVIQNQNEDWLYVGQPSYQIIAGFKYLSGWYNTHYVMDLNRTPAALGAREGDRITASFVAVPELYLDSYDLTREDLTGLLDSGVLGEGAFISSSFTVDSQAPELLNVYKDLQSGNLVVEARDENHVAGIQVQSTGGRVYATALPQQETAGETVRVTIDLSQVKDKVGQQCVLVVGDYAKNETAVVVDYGGQEEDFSGQIFGFTKSEVRGSGRRWIRLTPDQLWYGSDTPEGQGGLENLEQTDLNVMAAEYVNGYVFMAADDGYIYVGRQGAWDTYTCGGPYSQTTDTILDMAYNYQNNTLYALDGANTVWSVDLYSLELTKVAEITIHNPASVASAYAALTMMTIDDQGNFYVVNNGTETCSFLYRFTLDQVVDGAITGLEPVVNNKANATGYFTTYGSLAWDHNQDLLYMATSSYEPGAAYGYMAILNPETGKGSNVNDDLWVEDYSYASRLFLTVRGLYVVPQGNPAEPITMTDEAVSIELNRSSAKGLVGTDFPIVARSYPWNRHDTRVLWSSSDETVAEVNQRGIVTLVGPGTATITATTSSEPHLSASCQVIAESVPDFMLDALVYDANEKAQWARFSTADPENWTAISDKSEYYHAGTALNGYIYAHDNSNVYRIDPETFETTATMSLAANRRWSDAAPAPAVDGVFGRLAVVYNNGKYAGLVDPETGKISQFNTMLYMKGTASLAAIAYVGSGTYDYQDYADRPAHFYYILNEAGVLWHAVMVHLSGTTYRMVAEPLGSTGLELPQISYITSNSTTARASMVYDPQSGYLFVSSYLEGEEAQLHAIQPESLIATNLGSFGLNVWPVVALHTPLTDTTNAIPHHFFTLQGEGIPSQEVTLSETGTSLTPAVQPGQEEDCGSGTSTLVLTAEGATNGLVTVDYDETQVSLVELNLHGAYQAVVQEPGKVTLAYVSETPLEEVATLTFRGSEASMIVVTTLEENHTFPETQEGWYLQPAQHDYTATVTREPTCTEPGIQTWVCGNCGHSYEQELEPLGHSYEALVTPPSCQQGGCTTHTCVRCGDSYVTDETPPYCPSSVYTDVSKDHWFHEAVDFVTAQGLMEGMGEGIFAPNATATRAQLVMVLYRMEGMPETAGASGFVDVEPGAWYAEAVAWATETGITRGVSETHFAPNQAITRQQLVTILYRYAASAGLDVTGQASLESFSDAGEISGYALEAMAWAVDAGIISGMGDGTLAPNATATRAQIATVLRNFCQGE